MIIFAPNLKEKMNWTDIKDYKEANLELVLEEVKPSSKAEVAS